MALTSATRRHTNAYNIFILVLTIISLVIMALMFLPLSEATISLLRVYDNLICVIFLIDFFLNLRAAPRKSDYFIRDRGWLDLLGSIPSLGLGFRFNGLLRLARLSRLARILRLLRGESKKALVDDVIQNRSQYVAFITILLTIIVLTTASVLVLQFESKSPDANITTGGDSLWYAIVTITTVGYGDRYPVTLGGRITAAFIMFMGVGIIGVLASILSSVLVGPPTLSLEESLEETILEEVPALLLQEELKAVKVELAAMRQLLEQMRAG